MKTIILAAGEGKRMMPLTNSIPKCMLPYKGEPVLKRLIRQIKKQDVDEIIVVVGYKKEKIMDSLKDVTYVINDRYDKDTNSYSMYLGLTKANTDVVIYEADIIVEDEFIRYTFGTDFENESVWFVSDRFKPSQNGGIIKTNGRRNVLDIKILDKYDAKYSNWYKTTGVLRIAKRHVPIYKNLLKQSLDVNQYFHMVWKNNIDVLPSIVGETKYYAFSSFNTIKDYHKAITKEHDFDKKNRSIKKVPVNSLHPIEGHDANRIPIVRDNIIKNQRWKIPIRIERNFNLVLDGHHSLELARQMDLNYIPAICFDYDEINIWSLREDRCIEKDEVVSNALKNNIYPYKTIKHKFPSVKCKCNISLEELKNV